MYDSAAIWSYLHANVHPAVLTWIVPFVWQFVVYWAIGLAFLFVDVTHRPAALFAAKLQPNNVPSRNLLIKVAINVVLNQLFVLPIVMFASYYLSVGRLSYRFDASLPDWGTFLWELFGCLAGLEITFYYSHYAFHSKALYKYHGVHHAVTAPFGYSADYLHPLEFASMTAGGCIAAMFMHAHIWTVGVFFAVGNGGGVINHSGYRLLPEKWTPEWMMRDPDYHDWHHVHPSSNLSFLRVMDYLHGTNKSWVEHWKRVAEAKRDGTPPPAMPAPTPNHAD